MDENETELGEEGTKYFYNNRNLYDYENKILSVLSSVRVIQRHFDGKGDTQGHFTTFAFHYEKISNN